jgi:hypothetical protein
MPPKNKAKNAPNQHDKRHESGLAPPGKRVAKKHSNGHLNGQPNGKPVAAGQTPVLPTANQTFEGAPQAAAKEHAGPWEGAERDRTYSDASIEDGGQCGEMGDGRAEHGLQVTGGEAIAPTSRSIAPGHVGSTCSTISTILAYYPLRDAISILILLLSLPPTLVLVIQTLFASLTFVPPTSSISLSTLPNIKEMFNSANLGYPALATILIVDLIFWVCWLPLWKPIQVILLDLSQAVIAVSLSGAAASTGGPTYSIATCTSIVCIVHVLRYRAIHLTALDYLRSVLHKVGIGVQLDVPSYATSFVSSPSIDKGWLYTVFRTILGIHIVSQGVTTCIRRSLVKANEQGANVPAITKTDSEAAPGTELNTRPSAGGVEGTQHAVSTSSTDGRAPGPSPAHRDSKARESNGKKKRKQANQVRSQQPLWAAIASTKVTFVKEMEQRDSVDDAREATRMDTTTSNTFTSNIHHTSNRIWIREVRDTEILFGVELSPNAAKERLEGVEERTNLNAGIDKSKPFYIRINGAAWSSTRIMSIADDNDSDSPRGERYDGEIFGLAPLSSYECQLVGISDHNILCSASVITQPAPTPEQTASASSQPTHQGLRPASPITTLKQSIQTAELKLNETRNRMRKSKKDQRAVHADIKREINTLKSKLETSGGSDDKQERRLTQINQHKAQAEEAATELKEQIDAVDDTPAVDTNQSEAARSKWQSAMHAKNDATKDLDDVKSQADREIKSLTAEINQMESKREKLAARRTQRTEELEQAVSKQLADMTAKQKRDFERGQLKQKREKEQSDAHSLIASLDQDAQSYQQKTHDTYQQIATLQSWSSQQQPPPYYSSPPTPETAHPGAAASLGSPQSNGFPAFGPQQFNSQFHSAQPSIVNPQGGPRGRSSSMLSQYSGFTDNGEEYSFAPEIPRAQLTWPLHPGSNGGAGLLDDRKESEGSGSASLNNGSTGSNSPRPDAKVFVPGKSPGAVGTIGPPSKNKEKSPQSPVAVPGAIGSGR